MKDNMSHSMGKNKTTTTIAIVIFAAISAWYLQIHMHALADTESVRQLWGSIYQIMAIFGGIVGLVVSRHWGGYKSLIGRAVLFFSIGLLLQSFGQSVDSYYNYFHNQQIPYPSLGDIGFMGSVLAYIEGAYLLMKASGFRFSVKSLKGKFFAIALPIVILVTCYFFFLQGYVFDWTNKIKILLDFAYPLGQAFYVSLALLVLLMSRNFLGGVMKRPITFLVVALIFQYISDFTFLYQANAQTWYVGGLNDYLYFCSYFLMALSLINMGGLFKVIKEA